MNRRALGLLAALTAVASVGTGASSASSESASSASSAVRPESATPPSTPSSDPPADSVPFDQRPVTDAVVIRQAKIGLLGFVNDNFDRPDRVTTVCPALDAAQMTALVTFAGLRPSERPYLTTVVWDGSVGGGVVAVHCAQDDVAAAKPAGSSSFVMDVTMLDGRASFEQYAVKIGGPNALIGTADAVEGASIAGACTKDKKTCTGVIGVSGLAITIKLNNLPPADSLAKMRAVLNAVAPLVIRALTNQPGP